MTEEYAYFYKVNYFAYDKDTCIVEQGVVVTDTFTHAIEKIESFYGADLDAILELIPKDNATLRMPEQLYEQLKEFDPYGYSD